MNGRRSGFALENKPIPDHPDSSASHDPQMIKAIMRGQFDFYVEGVHFRSQSGAFDWLMRRHMPGSRNAVGKPKNDPVPGSIKSPSELKQACKDICDKMGRNPAFRERVRKNQRGTFEEYVEYGGAVFQVQGRWQ